MTDAPALTPTVRSSARRGVFWIVLGAIAAAVILAIIVAVGGASSPGPALGRDNPAPSGGQAVARVLAQHGVTVTAADTLAEARKDVTDRSDTTLLFYDPNGYLSGDRLRQVAGLAGTTVLVKPSFAQLRAFAPGVRAGGSVDTDDTTVPARCGLAAATKAGRITARGVSYRITDGDATGCFPTGGGRYALVVDRAGDDTVVVVGQTAVLSNEHVTEAGNAALALNLLGSAHRLVWYLPTLADAQPSGPPSLGELTPGWVTPVAALLIAVAAAAALWRGRRFGPLVAENLPVTVKAAETVEGRARLYQRSSARLRALDALRIGTVGRLATRLGLGRSATIGDVADAVSAVTGRNPRAVRALLVDDAPATDADLMRLSDGLAALERDVAGRIGHSSNADQEE